MQQPPSMMPVMSSLPPATITTEQIQKYLDENKKLILAILDNQNLGKLAECAQYQAQLQKNLMYLAAIADAQPQMAALPAQVAAHPTMQPGAYYVQHPQAAAAAAAAATAAMAAQPPGFFPPRMPAQFSAPHQLHEQAQPQHQQALHGQLNVRPAGPSNGMTHTEGPRGGGTPTGPSSNKQDGAEAGPTGSARCAGEGEETK